MEFNEEIKKLSELSQVFRPSAPIDSKTLFSGRQSQMDTVIDAVFQPGQHVILYGERGVGKTSLAKTLGDVLRGAGITSINSGTINCDGTDDFSSLWHKVFREIELITTTKNIGFGQATSQTSFHGGTLLPQVVTPDDVRYGLMRLPNGSIIIILDEVDRISDKNVTTLLSDTLKNLSDHVVNVTVILVGVADSVDQLISQHRSVERALVQVPIPRMSENELKEIVEKGFKAVGMEISALGIAKIAKLSQGLPHFTHLLSLNSGTLAVKSGSLTVTAAQIKAATKDAVDRSHSLLSAFVKAVTCNQTQNLYEEVLLGCALATKDELGWFSASSVLDPLSDILKRPITTPYYARHLSEFCDAKRGHVLEKSGTTRRFRYRFTNPLMQPFVILHSLAKNLVDDEFITKFS